ncbi:MAG: fimbria major subunit [Bacteroidales bacterium]|nr:fimbria major subunit [Bacteroidales bacterium]
MKKILYLSLAIAAMMAVGCNKNVAKNDPFVLPEGEKAYLALGIDLPSATATKADGDQSGNNYGQYNDGTADAANVEDIILVLFGGENEAAAELKSAYNLSEYRNTFAPNPYDQVTVSSSKIIAEIAKSTLGSGEVYAFLILNDHGFYEIEGTDLFATASGYFTKGASAADGSMTNATTGKVKLTGMPFAEFQKVLIDEGNRNYAETSFMMTNATYVKNGNVATLVPVLANLYTSRAAAEQNPAATINVERVLAKVQVTWANDLKITNTGATESERLPIEVTAWDLDNVNTIAYISKNFKSTWKSYGSYNLAAAASAPVEGKSRMVDSKGIESLTGPSFRTHWAIDPNYDKTEAVEYTLFTRANQDNIAIERKKDAIYYCPENTFNVEYMTDNNTTRLVIKTKLNEGKDFYTVTENATVLYQNDVENAGEDSIQEYIYAALGNKKEIRTWMETYSLTGTVKALVDIKLTQAYMTVDGDLTAIADGNTLVPGQHVVTFTVKSTVAEAAKTAFADLATENNAYFAKSYKFYYYKSGVAFYQALIKHFGDIETNWEQKDGMVNETLNEYNTGVYSGGKPTPEERYLGRYGIVRNNWYNINVTGIRNIGSSVVPSLPGKPDDTVENYIAIQINIMPWVMRPQDVIL